MSDGPTNAVKRISGADRDIYVAAQPGNAGSRSVGQSADRHGFYLKYEKSI